MRRWSPDDPQIEKTKTKSCSNRLKSLFRYYRWAMDSNPDPVILPGDPVSLISRLEPGQLRARPRASQGPGQGPAKGQAKGQPRARRRASQGPAKGQPGPGQVIFMDMDLVVARMSILEEIRT